MCSTNLFIFLATNEHKFLLNSIRIVFAPHGISVHWCNSWLKKIIVSGFPKYCLWTTSILLPKQKYDCKPICYIPNVAFAPLGRTPREKHNSARPDY